MAAMPTIFSMELHHGGSINWLTGTYEGGSKEFFERCSTDYISLIQLERAVRSLSYIHTVKFVWNDRDGLTPRGLVLLHTDEDVLQMSQKTIMASNKLPQVFMEHPVDIPNVPLQVPLGTEGGGDTISIESAESISYPSGEEGGSEEATNNEQKVDGPTTIEQENRDGDYDSDYVSAESESISTENDGVDWHDSDDEVCVDEDQVPLHANVEEFAANEPLVGSEDKRQCASYEISGDYQSETLNYYVEDSETDEATSECQMLYRPQMMSENFRFELEMEFTTLDMFKEAIREWNVIHGRQIRFTKSDFVRCRAECKKKCGWVVLLSKVGGTMKFQVKTAVNKHTCPRLRNNPSATSKWVASKIKEAVRRNPGYTLGNIVDKIGDEHNVVISRQKAQRARKITLDAILGTHKEQYAKLWQYAAEIKRSSPQNTCGIVVERPAWSPNPIFQRFYVCFEACKMGFLASCRPFIGLDDCFLKTNFKQQLLTAVATDPNGQYFPLVEVENRDSWTWFLTLLLEDIGPIRENKWVFISDQQKGLLQTFDNLAEGTEHRFCCMHLWKNMRKRWAGAEYHRLFWAAAKATYQGEWQKQMDQLKKLDESAWAWLMRIPKHSWTRHAMSPYPRCDMLLNNICEVFNARILQAWDKPILTMLESVRQYLLDRWMNNREKLLKCQGDIMPNIKKKLEKRVQQSARWTSRWSGEKYFEVSYTNSHFIVNLEDQTCSCRAWQLSGVPCAHSISAIYYVGAQPEDYVSNYFKRAAYERCYDRLFSSLNGEDLWLAVTQDKLDPPPFKKSKAGRPKKQRRQNPLDSRIGGEPPRKLTRKGTVMRCSRCGSVGHNMRRCKMSATGTT